MNCPKCQTKIAAGFLFCPKCGSQLPGSDADNAPFLGAMPTQRPAAQPRRWKTGEKVLGRYRILGELGQGGMGVVYRCDDEIGGIEIALKALPPELSHNSVEMEEVRENFRLVERLHHPHISAVKTLERDADTGDYYLILELAEGVDLRRWRKQKGGKVSFEEVLPILRQIAEALDFAHTRKIIHRDVKPANVMVAPDGTVKVLDFGLAAQIQTSLSRVSQVKYGTSGTGPYMAPEQWRGQYQDGASDQYALAVLAYELLAGHLPFENADAVVLQQAVLNLAPEAVAGMDPSVWSALHRGLAKERAARYGSCGELVAALAGGEAEIRKPKAESRRKAESRKPKSRWFVAAAVLLLAAGLAGWYFGIQRPQQAAEKSRKGELARLEAQARAANDGKEKARIEAEAERLRTEREKQQAADKVKAAAEQRERERRANAKGGLVVKTAPSGATATLGGEDVQASPATFKGVKTGIYLLRLSLEGYEPLSREVEIKENEFMDLGTVALVRSTGHLQVNSEPEGTAYELSRAELETRRGTTPNLVKDLPTGSYSLTMRRGDWEQSTKVTVRRGETVEGKVAFAYGSVSVKSEPSGATVMAAGKELGTTAFELKEARPGLVGYTLKLARHKDASVSGTVVEQQTLRLTGTLERQAYPVAQERWENSLGMKFVPVPGTQVLFSVWDTRVQDYAAYAKANSGVDRSWEDPNYEGRKVTPSENCPVVNVSWENARAFCGWLTKKERADGKLGPDQSYRLPADWEWTVAVGLNEPQGGTPKEKDGKIGGVYPWGTQLPPPSRAGNYADVAAKRVFSNWSVIEGYDDGYATTAPVGSFDANRYGLYDMGGNVWQWCEDWYDTDQKYRVLRGASWDSRSPDFLLSSYRNYGAPGIRDDSVGFRCVLVVGSSP